MLPIPFRRSERSLESIDKGEWYTSTAFHSLPQETLSVSSQELGGQVRRKPVDSSKVEIVAGNGG